jgi:phosphatidylserine/phosphatidylglycerophosphate/cardiolipin synthase-like enzyme
VAVIFWAVGLPARGGDGKQAKVSKRDKSGASSPPVASEGGISVYFSPNGGCTEAIVRAISEAKQSIFVQAAQFTSPSIARALVSAHQRGVDVRVILDRRKDDNDHSQTDRLVDSGLPAFADGSHHTAHNKVILIDHRLIITGSFNFTTESESENAENLLLIDNKPDLVLAYEKNFKEHLGHSKPYEK